MHEKIVQRNPKLLLAGIICLAALALDQITKFAILRFVENREIKLIPSILSIKLVYNESLSFGFQIGKNLVALSLIIGALALVIIAKRVYQLGNSLAFSGLALLSAGAAGNLIDRLRIGSVIDFINIPFWSVFNIADICIVIGIIFVCITLLQTPEEYHQKESISQIEKF